MIKKVSFNTNEVLPSLSLAVSIVNQKNTIPALDSVHVMSSVTEDGERKMSFTTSDSETWFETCLSYKNEDDDDDIDLCIDAKSLLQAIRNLGEQHVVMHVDDENHEVMFRYENGFFSMPYSDASEFPTPDLLLSSLKDRNNHKRVPAQKMSNALTKTIPFTIEDELRPILGGVKIDFYADGMVAAATDSRKLVKYKDLTVTHNGVEQSVLGYVLRRKTCALLANVFQTVTDDEMVEIYFNTSVVRMHCGNNFITSRLVEGTYPNYDSVIPLNNNIVVELDRNTIVNAIKRVMPMGNNETDLVILDFKESMLTICAEDLDYGTSATENIPCEYAYEPLKIGLKGRSLLQTLQNVDGENVRMMFRNPQSAVVVTPSDTNGNIEHLSLLMPMKLS